ncbi:hypothetical protein BJ912DRAFT_948114 [Pholiota molesta]|nr:hypothetical protein BJ912DRAFT_948114 [Pholiota molesta]
MGRTKRATAIVPPPPPSTATPPSEPDPPPASSTRPPKIEWSKNPDWTWSLIAYLTTHSSFRTKLFSDSTADATKNGRAKVVGKEGKNQMYGTLAKALFGEMPGQMEFYALDSKRFAVSVETRLRRLKSEYSKHLKELGSTGAGLSPEDVTPGSELANLVDRICSTWPWWKELHSFWRELPNYNPISVTTSTPGLDHAAEASALFDENPPSDREPSPLHNDLDQDGHQADAGINSDLDGEKGNEEEDDEEEDQLLDSIMYLTDDLPLVGPLSTASCKHSTPCWHPRFKASSLSWGRDAGLAKANASVSKQVPKTTPLERFNENRTNETARLARKHEMDHELKLINAKNKRYKYEYKYGAPQRVAEVQQRAAEVQLRAAEADRQARIEEMKLRVELARIQAGAASAIPIQRAPLTAFNADEVVIESGFTAESGFTTAPAFTASLQNGSYNSDDVMYPASSSSSMDAYSYPNMYDA